MSETKWVARLVEVAEHDLRAILHAVVEDSKFAGLKFYRNLAAHRGVIGEQQRGGEVEKVGVDGVRFMLPDWLPMEAPDHPSYSVRPVLRKYLEWGRPALAGLNAVASAVWVPAEHESEELAFTDEMFEDVPTTELVQTEPGVPRAPTRYDLAPRIGEWRAWFEWGSHNFEGDPRFDRSPSTGVRNSMRASWTTPGQDANRRFGIPQAIAAAILPSARSWGTQSRGIAVIETVIARATRVV